MARGPLPTTKKTWVTTWVSMPACPGEASPLNGIDGFYVNPNSKNVDGALALALFLTNKESSQIYTDKAGHVAIRSDVKASDPLVAAFAEASASGYPRPQSAEFANFWGPSGMPGPRLSKVPRLLLKASRPPAMQ